MSQTAAQICATARSIAAVPNYKVQSGQALNEALADICETQNFDLARGTFSFNFNVGLLSSLASFPTLIAGGGPYALPADYLRADYGDIFFMDQGVPHRLVSIDLYQFDLMVQQAGLQSYPTLYATDLSLQYSATPVMVVYSPPQSNYQVIGRYRRQMPDIVTPEASNVSPWFPYTNYLVEKTAANLMRIVDDTRWKAFDDKARETMSSILKLANDNSGRAKTVKLDQRRFGVDQNSLPLTKQIWL